MRPKLLILIAVLAFVAPAGRASAVAGFADNDNFSDAAQITGLPFDDQADATLATRESGEPSCTYDSENVSVWYRFEPASQMDVAARGGSSGFLHNLAVYEGTALAALSQIGCHAGQYSSSITFTAQQGHVYYFQLGSYTRGLMSLHVEASQGFEGHLIDQHGNAAVRHCVYAYPEGQEEYAAWTVTDDDGGFVLLVPAGTYRLLYSCPRYVPEWYPDAATRDAAAAVVTAPGSRTRGIDGVVTLRGVVSGRVTREGVPVSTCVELWNVQTATRITFTYSRTTGMYDLAQDTPVTVAVRFGCAYTDTEQEWYDDALDFADATPLSMAPGEEISGIDADLAGVAPPPNDSFAAAETVEPSAARVLDTRKATVETGEPTSCLGTTAVATAWYRYTPPAGTKDLPVAATLEMKDPYYRGVLAVYTGTSLLDLRLLRCATGQPSLGQRVALGFPASDTHTYFIQVASAYVGAQMTMNLLTARADGWTPISFDSALPCGPVCPYWQEPQSGPNEYRAACNPEPFASDDSFADVAITVPAILPDGSLPTALLFRLNPVGDSDSFICATQHDANESYFVSVGANSIEDACDVRPVGCPEAAAARVRPGETYILRVYNWSDWATAPGTYAFASVPS
ncbi:MAG: hypothetical protein ABR548_08120 [Actinomycetota bacterium]